MPFQIPSSQSQWSFWGSMEVKVYLGSTQNPQLAITAVTKQTASTNIVGLLHMLTKSHLLCLQQPSHILIAEGYKFIIHMMIYLFLKFFWGGGVGWGGVGVK